MLPFLEQSTPIRLGVSMQKSSLSAGMAKVGVRNCLGEDGSSKTMHAIDRCPKSWAFQARRNWGDTEIGP